jgi:hypothetical protein
MVLLTRRPLARRVARRRAPWQLRAEGWDRWQVVNTSGAVAEEVRIVVEGGGVHPMPTGDKGDVHPGGSLLISAARSPGADAVRDLAPVVTVTWRDVGAGRRMSWACTLPRSA